MVAPSVTAPKFFGATGWGGRIRFAPRHWLAPGIPLRGTGCERSRVLRLPPIPPSTGRCSRSPLARGGGPLRPGRHCRSNPSSCLEGTFGATGWGGRIRFAPRHWLRTGIRLWRTGCGRSRALRLSLPARHCRSNPSSQYGRPLSGPPFGWGGRIRTLDTQDQNLLPYHLATPQGKGKCNVGAGLRKAGSARGTFLCDSDLCDA